MIFWGFVMWFVGAVAGIMALLVGATGIMNGLDMFGFSGYFARLVDPANLTAKKIVFLVALVLIVIGLIVFFLGRAKVRRTGEPEKAGARALKYWRDTKGEYKKITWPSFKTVVQNTGVTLIVCALVAVFVCLVDLGLSALIDLFLNIG